MGGISRGEGEGVNSGKRKGERRIGMSVREGGNDEMRVFQGK